MPDYLTWQQFNDAVRALLPLDKNRLGLQDKADDDGNIVPGYITLMLRQAVIDLQRFVPVFRKWHETLYYPQDFATEGNASRGVLPPMAMVKDAYLFNTDKSVRYPLNSFPWELRHELTNAIKVIPDNNGLLCIEPDGYKFYVYPVVTGPFVLSLNWDAQLDTGKSDFQAEELVPFPEDSVLAVAEYVKGQIVREVNRDVTAFNTYFHPVVGTYCVLRRNLYLTAKERTRTNR